MKTKGVFEGKPIGNKPRRARPSPKQSTGTATPKATKGKKRVLAHDDADDDEVKAPKSPSPAKSEGTPTPTKLAPPCKKVKTEVTATNRKVKKEQVDHKDVTQEDIKQEAEDVKPKIFAPIQIEDDDDYGVI